MIKPIDRDTGLMTDLRMLSVDFDRLYAEESNLIPLECIEIFLLE